MGSGESNAIRSRSYAVRDQIRDIPSMLSSNSTVIAVVGFLYLIPLGTTASTSPIRTLLYILTEMMIFGLLAMSFDLQLGRAALLNFGHVALFGVGSYCMAYTLDPDILFNIIAAIPYPFSLVAAPFGLIAAIPYPLTLVLAMMVGGFLGLIMGLTTSRMKGTAFAFIALAISMFIYNFFAENPGISGGETGLGVATPDLIRTAPFYLMFVGLAFVFLAALVGIIILYLKKRTEKMGLALVTPVMVVLTGLLLAYGTSLFGVMLVVIAFLGMVYLYLNGRDSTIADPLQFSESQAYTEGKRSAGTLTRHGLPFVIIALFLIGFAVAFGNNIAEMVALWVEDRSTFYYTIPVQYYLVLTCVVITYFLVKRMMASPFGRMITAVAQNEDRAKALGFNCYRAKVVVLVISGAIASLSGALYAPYMRVIDPETTLGVGITIDAMLFTIIGGIGTLFGPLLGAGVVEYSELNLVDFITNVLHLDGRLWLVGLGVIYVIIVLFMPHGIAGSIGRRSGHIREKLRRLRFGRFEFGLKDADYWVFGLLGGMGLFLFLMEDIRFLIIAYGIVAFLGVTGCFLFILAFGNETKSRVARTVKALAVRLRITRGG